MYFNVCNSKYSLDKIQVISKLMTVGAFIFAGSLAFTEQKFLLESKARGGNKKKKKKKPTEWFLRQLKMERERRERTRQPREQVQREIPACVHYAAGKCAKVCIDVVSSTG